MSDIDEMVSWLRDVLDDDERVARDAGGRNWGREAYGCVVDAADNGLIVYSEGTPSREQADHIARHDPAHELNVVAAHRAIIDLHHPDSGGWDGTDKRCQECGGYELRPGLGRWGYSKSWPCPTLRALAAGYAGRDGYKAEWGQA